MTKEIKAFAPASIGNVGVGFDVLGLALEYPGDEVVIRHNDMGKVRIVAITGDGGKLPLGTEQNTAGMAVLRMLQYMDYQGGVDIEVHKKLPLGSGMGSSAASAVAAVVAANELLQAGLSKSALLPFACAGEAVASGSVHADNTAPSLLGGITLIRENANYDIVQLPVPEGLYVALVHPDIKVLTQEARAILSATVPMGSFVRQTAQIAAFVAALYTNNFPLLGRSLKDMVIEPQRAQLIKGFYRVQDAAMSAGALGCTISGAGPAMFALCAGQEQAEQVGLAMQNAFDIEQIQSRKYVSAVNQSGAILL